MKKLYKGIHKFSESYYKKKKKLFEKLEKGQNPTVLFITCSDSRIDPNLVTNSKPGELFILRNVGNIIPPFDAVSDKNSIAAAVEFAIESLKIRDIIVCGHSNCGAMKAIYANDDFFEKMPHLKNWLQFASPLKDIINNLGKDDIQRNTEQQNIILQLKNLITYPSVAELFEKEEIRLYGWYYEIGTGKIYELDRESGKFKLIEPLLP
ncbi:MAG: carbonic anhydrase [Proteobacteria bacterium]|nr:carbonic anhydrase [Pseudomonadota bacterium]